LHEFVPQPNQLLGEFDVLAWLNAFEPGFVQDELSSLTQFTLLWSLFEAQVCANRASVQYLREKVEQWSECGILDPVQFQPYLEYLRNRYVVGGEPTYRFEYLDLREKDNPGRVLSVLKGETTGDVDIVTAILTIVYRYRSNLFHGLKWAYNLRGQEENFDVSTRILARALDINRRAAVAT
jgi:hypothetical protein